ncbi:MAG: hypothetical protein AAB738_01945 [Patescibacteria group bacterium]
MKKYHFKPKKLGYIAGYYPVTWQGWLVTLILVVAFVTLFLQADKNSHSASDTLINFAFPGTAILLIFDLLCFRMGEYPSWWHKKKC